MGVTDRYCKPEDLPRALPVFPLRGVILLPRSTVPLNVFEPRYLELVDDVLAGERIIGLVQPHPSAGVSESPPGKSVPLAHVGCAGRLTSYAEGDDGRVRIALTGVCRFAIAGEQTSITPYRIFQASYDDYIDDFVPGQGEGAVDRQRLLSVLKTYLTAHSLSADWDSINRSSNELLVNTLSMISPYGPEEKQALLEAADLKERAEVLMMLAEMDLAAPDDGSGTAVQ